MKIKNSDTNPIILFHYRRLESVIALINIFLHLVDISFLIGILKKQW